MRGWVAALVGIALMALSSGGAHAQWFYDQGEDDPFAGGSQHLAMSLARSGELIGFRCTSADDLVLLFVSNEKPDPQQMAAMMLMPAKLLVIVDDASQQEFDASIEVTADGDRYRFSGEGDGLADVARAASAAKKRFAVAAEMMGKRMYSAAVNVRGSGRAIGQLVKGCGLP